MKTVSFIYASSGHPYNKQLLFVSVLILFLTVGGRTQTQIDSTIFLSNVQSLSLIGKHYGDSIVLRWAPLSADFWYDQLHKPLMVARREVSPNPGEYNIISDSIRLMPEVALEQFASVQPAHPLLIVLLNNAYRDWENSLYAGDIATMMEKATNFQNRWSLLLFAADRDPVVANAAGMRFVDKTIRKDVTYAYKVFIPGKHVASDHKIVHPRIRKFTPMIYQGFERDSSLVIQWQKHLHDAHYTAYHIERSDDGKKYTRLTSLPYVQASSNDPQLQSHFYTYTDRVANGKNYQYRLVGLDAFGDESQPSLPISLKAHDLEPPMSAMVDASVDSLKKGIHITWTHAELADVKNFRVFFAAGGNDPVPISNLLSSRDSTFFHQPEDFNGMGKYMVAASDKDGNVKFSDERLIRIPDFVPPGAPSGLIAVTDTSGLIRVRWDEATEKDIIGYFVYASDGDERHYHRLTPKLYPFRQFTDTVDVHSLTENRLYKVIAVDDAMNYSPYSEVLIVERPDVMPPSPAWIQSFDVSDSTITLHMVPSSSRDVVKHKLLRKLNAEEDWVTIASIPVWPENNNYVDASVQPNASYIYTLIAEDEKGLTSKSISEKHIVTPFNRSIGLHEVTMEMDTDSLPVIKWNDTDTKTSLQIYIKRNAQWNMLAELSSEEKTYKLKSYNQEPLMSRMVFADGSKSSSIILAQ